MLGNLEDFSLANILQMFERSSRSGQLSIWTPNGIYRIWFYQGRVMAGVSPQPENNLRNFLKSHPEADDKLKSFLSSSLSIDRPLGIHLKEKELVSRKLLADAFRQQLQIAVYSIINHPSGQFRFTSNLPFPYLEMTGLSKSAIEVALQGLRQVEKQKQLEASFPQPDSSFFRLTQELPLVNLSTLEWSIWERVSPDIPINNLAQKLGEDLLEIRQACSRLIQIGLLEEITAERRQEAQESSQVNEGTIATKKANGFLETMNAPVNLDLLDKLKNMLKSIR
ncbi:DUF4388 domain-containing protein [Merismopedia glauca]|nr:DUF4388 domain-containing protein [Merismopedia glauca]